MHIFLFVFYGVICCYAITKMAFFRDSRIRPSMLLLLFGLRVGAGCLHNFIAWRYFPGHGDIWLFFSDSLVDRRELFTDFHRFLADNPLAYLPYNTIEFLDLLFNFFSFDNFYIDTLLFSFLAFWGSIALFRFFREVFKDNLLCGCCALLIPSTLFWTSCIHKDGLIFLLLGFFYFHFYRGIRKGWTPGKVLLCFFLFSTVIFFRANMILTLLPALVLWVIKEKRWPSRMVKWSFSILLLGVCILLITDPGLITGILRAVSLWQGEFQKLTGNSRIWLPVLAPTIGSFGHVLPVAILNGFFQPLPGSGGQLLYLAFSIELLLIWLIAFYSLYYSTRHRAAAPASDSLRLSPQPQPDPRPQRPRLTPFGLSCILLSFSAMLMIGYTVPFVGAIIRYRSIYLPFLLVPFLYILRNHPLAQKLGRRLTRLLLEP